MFSCPCQSLPCWHRQRLDPAHHASKQPSRQVTFSQQRPAIALVLGEPAADLANASVSPGNAGRILLNAVPFTERTSGRVVGLPKKWWKP
jgi:hypothetical protein